MPGPRPRRKARSIRTQISALLWIAVLPLAALHVRSSYREYQLTVDNSSTLALELAEAVGTSTTQLLATAETQMGNAARLYSDRLLDPEQCPALTRSLGEIFDYLDHVGAHRLDGRPACWSLPADVPDSLSFIGTDWFEGTLSGRRLTVGEPLWGPYSGDWAVVLSVPVRSEDGAVIGALSGTLPAHRLQEMLVGVQIEADELVTIATQSRVVVARSADRAEYVGTTLPDDQGAERAFGQGRWMSEGPDFEGLARIWARVELSEHDWLVYAGIPSARIKGPARLASARKAGLSLLIVLLAGLFIASIHRRVVGSLANLVAGVGSAAEGRVITLADDAPEEVIAVARQLNRTLDARERAETAERAARLRFQSILDNAVFGIFVSTVDGRFLEVNPALVSMLGYDSAEELVAAGPLSLYGDALDRERIIEEHRDGTEFSDLESEWRRKDGRTIVVRLNGRVICTEDGQPAFEVIVEDITRSKALNEQLRQTQKMEAIGRLAGGVAHDFNNLLTVIAGNSEILLIDVAEDDPMRVELSEIAQATSRAEALTRQLLAFSRKDDHEARVIDPNEVVQGLGQMLGRLLNELIRIETDLDPGLPPVHADRGQLEQVIVNLVLNARDAMPSGGRILLATHGGTPHPGTAEDWVCIAVEDEGIGMDAETRSRALEPFFTTKKRGEGSGLGLATVYGIVSQAGGHVAITSTMGEGSRFEVWLPAASAEAARSEVTRSDDDRAPTEVGDRGAETILVVEDEDQVRRIVERVLGRAGYQVLGACDGHEGITIASDEDAVIDLVVTDVMMPRVSGTELAEYLDDTRPGTPILFISGHTFDLPVRHRIEADPECFLAKPFKSAELKARVRSLLDRSGAGRGAARGSPSGNGQTAGRSRDREKAGR